jgi:hypothetical protein
MNPFRHLLGPPGRAIRSTQVLVLHTAAQYRKTRTNIHVSSGTRNHDPSVRVVKTHATDRTVAMMGRKLSLTHILIRVYIQINTHTSRIGIFICKDYELTSLHLKLSIDTF